MCKMYYVMKMKIIYVPTLYFKCCKCDNNIFVKVGIIQRVSQEFDRY